MVFGGVSGLGLNSKMLEHPYPHTAKGMLKVIPALIILKPCSNFLEFAVGFGVQGLFFFFFLGGGGWSPSLARGSPFPRTTICLRSPQK